MGFSPKQTSKKVFRSISLPCRSHPSIYRIEKVLNKFKTWESTSSLSNPSAEIICSGVCQLTELYERLDDIVKTCLSQTSSISTNQNMKWADELLDVSVNFLDIFGSTSDLMLQTRQHVRDIGCDLRRKGGPTIIHDYIVFRKKFRKDVKRCVTCLNQFDNFIVGHFPLVADFENHHLTSVIRVFREVKASTSVVVRLLLKFLVIPVLRTRSTTRWTAVSRYVSGGNKVVPEEKAADTNTNELQSLDNALFRYSTSDKMEFIQHVQKKLVEFEVTVDDINSHLESMSRRMIATRASLLNLVSFC